MKKLTDRCKAQDFVCGLIASKDKRLGERAQRRAKQTSDDCSRCLVSFYVPSEDGWPTVW